KAKTKHPRSRVEGFAPEALTKLIEYDWPGNVRELGHTIERAVLLARDVEVRVTDLPTTLARALPPGIPNALETRNGGVLPIREVQRRYAAWALERSGGNKTRAAEALGVDAKTLAKWVSGE